MHLLQRRWQTTMFNLSPSTELPSPSVCFLDGSVIGGRVYANTHVRRLTLCALAPPVVRTGGRPQWVGLLSLATCRYSLLRAFSFTFWLRASRQVIGLSFPSWPCGLPLLFKKNIFFRKISGGIEKCFCVVRFKTAGVLEKL